MGRILAAAPPRGDSIRFDIVVGARERSPDWDQERSLIRSVAEAGATWWIEWVPANDPSVMRRAIEHGPLHID